MNELTTFLSLASDETKRNDLLQQAIKKLF